MTGNTPIKPPGRDEHSSNYIVLTKYEGLLCFK